MGWNRLSQLQNIETGNKCWSNQMKLGTDIKHVIFNKVHFRYLMNLCKYSIKSLWMRLGLETGRRPQQGRVMKFDHFQLEWSNKIDCGLKLIGWDGAGYWLAAAANLLRCIEAAMLSVREFRMGRRRRSQSAAVISSRRNGVAFDPIPIRKCGDKNGWSDQW